METALNAGVSPCRPLENSLDGITRARELHEHLIETANLAQTEKIKLAREIAGLLFTIETSRNLPIHLRQSLSRLRADADRRAGLSDGACLRSPTEVWDHYERLEAIAT